jgi:hypothetical protein
MRTLASCRHWPAGREPGRSALNTLSANVDRDDPAGDLDVARGVDDVADLPEALEGTPDSQIVE